MSRIRVIIMDWAGTAVDYGCFAPVEALAGAFKTSGLSPDIDEIRAPMGLPKREHIEKMLEGERLSEMWLEKRGAPPSARDIGRIYGDFEEALFETLGEYADPLPGVVETVERIRAMGILTGSTTGYTRAMMDIVAPSAREKGYGPDCIVCPEDTMGRGRPYPYMIWRNLERLGAVSIGEALKIGDTASDMEEARNAGCLSVGVIKGSSMLGLSEKELSEKSLSERTLLFDVVRRKYIDAGADYVMESIAYLPELIEEIEDKGKTKAAT